MAGIAWWIAFSLFSSSRRDLKDEYPRPVGKNGNLCYSHHIGNTFYRRNIFLECRFRAGTDFYLESQRSDDCRSSKNWRRIWQLRLSISELPAEVFR